MSLDQGITRFLLEMNWNVTFVGYSLTGSKSSNLISACNSKIVLIQSITHTLTATMILQKPYWTIHVWTSIEFVSNSKLLCQVWFLTESRFEWSLKVISFPIKQVFIHLSILRILVGGDGPRKLRHMQMLEVQVSFTMLCKKKSNLV